MVSQPVEVVTAPGQSLLQPGHVQQLVQQQQQAMQKKQQQPVSILSANAGSRTAIQTPQGTTIYSLPSSSQTQVVTMGQHQLASSVIMTPAISGDVVQQSDVIAEQQAQGDIIQTAFAAATQV